MTNKIKIPGNLTEAQRVTALEINNRLFRELGRIPSDKEIEDELNRVSNSVVGKGSIVRIKKGVIGAGTKYVVQDIRLDTLDRPIIYVGGGMEYLGSEVEVVE